MNSKARKHLETLRRRRDRLVVRVAAYQGGDPHPTRRELRALIWAINELEREPKGEPNLTETKMEVKMRDVEGGCVVLLDNIERCVREAEWVELISVVNGYRASLMTRRGRGTFRAVTARAVFAADALILLDHKLKDETLESVRAKKDEATLL